MQQWPHGPSQLERIRALLSNFSDYSHDEVEAVVGILLFENNLSDIEIMLLQRAEREGDPWSGHIGLPGGRIKSSDGSPVDACNREVREEVGIDLNGEGELLGSLEAGFPWSRPELKVQPLVYKLTNRPVIHLGPEVVDAFWVSLSRLPEMRRQSEVATRAGPRLVESFFVDGHVVWGFTFRVLNDLLDLKQSSG